MPEEEKELYKEQSKCNRDEYDEKRKTFFEQKATNQTADEPKLNVIEATQMRRLSRNTKIEAKKKEQE